MQMNEHHLQNETDWISNLLHIFCPQRMKKGKNERKKSSSLQIMGHFLGLWPNELWDI